MRWSQASGRACLPASSSAAVLPGSDVSPDRRGETWDRGTVLTSRLQTFEAEMLACSLVSVPVTVLQRGSRPAYASFSGIAQFPGLVADHRPWHRPPMFGNHPAPAGDPTKISNARGSTPPGRVVALRYCLS